RIAIAAQPQRLARSDGDHTRFDLRMRFEYRQYVGEQAGILSRCGRCHEKRVSLRARARTNERNDKR
ncbi:MAG: hypothetical protein OXT06_09520, partial [Rhodospirillaceae bacterium]|nr:hypothetical protein [Rhodospirillaceae bacterium]